MEQEARPFRGRVDAAGQRPGDPAPDERVRRPPQGGGRAAAIARLNGKLSDADRQYIDKAFSLFQSRLLARPHQPR